VAVLESAYESIKYELLNVLSQNRGFQEPRPVDQGIVGAGGWNLFWIKDSCKRFEENWALCPETKRVIDSLPRVGESATFSALRPGTHIQPHCGVANFRLALHLGLIIPDNCELRVGNETRSWEEGKCLVFNDSFVHEARNNSEFTRITLIVDLWHPDLTRAEVQVLEELLHCLDH
jgi:aspartate beta-hydroxylase